MPHNSLKLIPGVDQNKTPALNEAAISTTSFVRFISDRTLGGLVQKLGGWTKFFPNQIGSTVRALWAWEDTNSNSWLGVGATQSLSAIVDEPGASAKTITPQTTTASTSIAVTGASWSSGVATLTFSTSFPFQPETTVVVSGITPSGYDGTYVLTSGGSGSISYAKASDPGSYVSGGTIISMQGVPVSFSTTAGSSIVLVDDTGSALDAFDVVDIKTQVSVGGLILFGLYRVTPISANQYSIQARDVLGNPAYATSTVSGGGAVPSFEFTSSSATVKVTLNNHGLLVGDTFPVLIPVAAGGVTISGNYLVQSLDSGSPANIFTIQAANSATTTPTLTASGTGSVATLTFPSTYTVPVGSTIVVAGVTPGGYNGTYTVTRSSAGSVSYANATTGAQTVAGTIFVSVVKENNNLAGLIYFNGVGPLAVNSGYGVGGYGTGGYGSGIPPASGTGTPITNITDWSLDNWGETLIASPLNGPIYEWSPSANNPIATIIPEAPQTNEGFFVAMPQQQIIAYGSTFNGVKDALLIRWCDVANYNSWIGLVTNQAGSYRIPKGSRIIQGIQGPQQGLIWTDLAIWAMQYVGPPYVYQFNELGTGCGLIGRKAATSVNGVVYWMGQSQFFRLAGGGVEPIRCPVWDVIFQDLDTNNLDKIRVAPNSRFGEISWFYPTQSNGGEVSHYVKYNFLLDQWDFGTLARTAWINESVLGPPIGAAPDQFIYQHETSTDADGQAINASFQTGYFVLTEANVKMFIDQIWPDMKWGYYDGTQNAQVQLTFFVADYAGQTPLQYGPFLMTQATTFLTPRFRGRLVSIKVESNDIGSFWRLGNIRYRYQEDGKY
jgi:hypothetical protein